MSVAMVQETFPSVRVAVAPHRNYPGVWPPGYSGKTYDWRQKPRGPENTRGIVPSYHIADLSIALRHVYKTDAHFVPYVVPGMAKQPRLTKGGLQWFIEQTGSVPAVSVFFADIDNPEHSEWTEELRAKEEDQWNSLECLKTVAVYYTKRGYRIVQPLTRSIPVIEAEAPARKWLLSLKSCGVDIDENCRDWTRHYRAPNVVRDGARYMTPVLRLERMRPVDPPVLTAEEVESFGPKDEPTDWCPHADLPPLSNGQSNCPVCGSIVSSA